MPATNLQAVFMDQLDDLYSNGCLALDELERLEENARELERPRILMNVYTRTSELKRRIEGVLLGLGLNRPVMTSGPFERYLREALSSPENNRTSKVSDKSGIAKVQRNLKFEKAAFEVAIELGRQLGFDHAVIHLKSTGLLWEDSQWAGLNHTFGRELTDNRAA